jgi:hypothetical protein
MEYTQQASKPDWYQSDDSKLYFASTSGSSPFNEWYEFNDEKDAIDFINEQFESASYTDNMIMHNGVLYHLDDTLIDDDCEIIGIKPNAVINDFQAAVDFESRF